MEVVSWGSYDVHRRDALSYLAGPLKQQKTLGDARLVYLAVCWGGHWGIFGGLLAFPVASLTIIFLCSLAV